MGNSKYNMLKKEYPDIVILIKSGFFFIAYNQDAYIINNLFDYKVSDGKAYIPSNKINKIIRELTRRVSVMAIEKNGMLVSPSEKNDYENLLKESQNKYLMNKEIKDIKEKIKRLIEKDENNMELIERFLIENIN